MLGEAEVIGFAPTRDAAAARHFYADVLGLELDTDDGFALVFRAGRNRTMVRVVRAPEFTPLPFTILGWEVDDVHATVTRLRERGVEPVRLGMDGQDDAGVWSAPHGNQVAWFTDPDGNTLSVSHHA